jgi:diacylglycerol kinase (ATP)
MNDNTEPSNPQKQRKGINRIVHALGYSLQGLHSAFYEPAFRQELWLSLLLIPASFWIGKTWVEISLLVASVLLVMIVELLNTGLETAIDRIGPAWHDLSKRCKDLGSAAVLLSLILCVGVWSAAIFHLWQGY